MDWTLLGIPIKVNSVLPCICWHDFAGRTDPF